MYRNGDRDNKHQVPQPLEHQDHLHFYRHKLEKIIPALKDADENLKFPHQTTQYMDCESALKSLWQELYKPGHTMGTDSDLTMAHHHLKAASCHTITEEWVMGHATEKKKDFPKEVTPLEEDDL